MAQQLPRFITRTLTKIKTMKRKLTFILIMISFWANAQLIETEFYHGKVYDKTGKSIEGLISLRSSGGIQFKIDKESKTQFFDQKQISGFEFEEDGELNRYEYKLIQKNIYKLLKVVEKNKYINLYNLKIVKSYSESGISGAPLIYPIMFGQSDRYTIYYIEKNNVTIKVGRDLEKNLNTLFSDCPSLVKQIKNEEFGVVRNIWQGDKIEEIVRTYNKCNNPI